jgi:hypothetical protein
VQRPAQLTLGSYAGTSLGRVMVEAAGELVAEQGGIRGASGCQAHQGSDQGAAARSREGAGEMMRFKNVPEPAGFQEAVHENKESILADFEKNRTVDFKGRETWTRFKSDMVSATFGKCGYCEVNVTAVDRFKGDVEHYRPKGRVDRLVVEPDGTGRLNPCSAPAITGWRTHGATTSSRAIPATARTSGTSSR